MNIKELKEKIADLPDDMLVLTDHGHEQSVARKDVGARVVTVQDAEPGSLAEEEGYEVGLPWWMMQDTPEYEAFWIGA